MWISNSQAALKISATPSCIMNLANFIYPAHSNEFYSAACGTSKTDCESTCFQLLQIDTLRIRLITLMLWTSSNCIVAAYRSYEITLLSSMLSTLNFKRKSDYTSLKLIWVSIMPFGIVLEIMPGITSSFETRAPKGSSCPRGSRKSSYFLLGATTWISKS